MWLLQQSRERDKEEKCLETWTPNSFTGSSGSWTAHMTLEFGLPHWNACTGTMFESAGIHFINNLWTGLWPTDYCSNAVTCNGVTVFVTFWVLFAVFDSNFYRVLVTGFEYKINVVFTDLLRYFFRYSVFREKILQLHLNWTNFQKINFFVKHTQNKNFYSVLNWFRQAIFAYNLATLV